MFKKVSAALTEYNMLCGKRKVIVALSGGADSMCLLDCMLTLADDLGVTVAAAHLNHCLRGDESERDNLFVREQCGLRGVELYERRVDIAALAAERKQGLEECGRKARYDFFAQLARDGVTAVATAHTASDNAETVLLNLVRGCGVDGLSGIPPVRGNIIRPLIYCTREEIERYCTEKNIPYVTDSTNLTDDYSRNKIRLNILPQLREINPSADTAINRLSQLAKAESRYISAQCVEILNRCEGNGGYVIDMLLSEDRDILPSVVRAAVEKHFGITAEKRHIDIIVEMTEQGHGGVQLRKNAVVRVSGGVLLFDRIVQDHTETFEPVCPNFGEVYLYDGKSYVFSEKKSKKILSDNKINKKLLYLRLKCDILSCDTVLRQRMSGDFFRPYGRNCTKTVKKLFTEMKIPVNRRDKLLLLARGSEVLWIEGIGASENAAPDTNDDYFTIEVDKAENEQ